MKAILRKGAATCTTMLKGVNVMAQLVQMRHIRYWLTTVVVLLCSVVANAQQQHHEVDGIYYVLDYYNDAAHVVWSNAEEGYTGDIIIPSSITYDGKTYQVEGISSEAFRNDNVTSVVIPEGVVKIGNNAFDGCSILTDIVIPSSLQSIGGYAFRRCKSLKAIDIPSSVYWIGDGAFYGCYSLTNVDIPEGIQSIKSETFTSCWNLISVTLPRSLTIIESSAFSNCAFSKITLPDALTKIEYCAFGDCKNLESITIPGGVAVVDDYAFSVCNSLADIVISEGVEKIGGSAFSNCDSLVSVSLPQTLKTIGSHAFFQCRNLAAIDIPKSVVSIGEKAFQECSLSAVVIPEGVTVIEDDVFAACCNLVTVTLPEGVTEIENGSFKGCTSLASITLPNSLREMGKQAFYQSGIEHITIPGGVAEITESAFRDCNKLKTVDISEGVTKIGTRAFMQSGITSIILPESMKEIDPWGFGYCDSLHTIVCKGAIPPACAPSSASSSAFDSNVKSNSTLFVPDSSMAAYQEAKDWKDFYNIYPLSLRDKDFTLTYLVDGEVYRVDSLKFRDPITLAEEPDKEGHTFSGWSEAPEMMPAENVTIVGTFTANKYLVTFKIDGEVIASDSLVYGTAILTPEAPEREGHTFSGWGEVAETVPANDLTYEAHFTVNSYMLTYVVDDKTVQTDSVTYGTVIIPLEEPTKEGHTFSGWSELPETMPASDVTVSGTFVVNKYLVTFKIDGEVIASDSLEYGAAIIVPEAPEREGHTFSGWGEVAETVPANDLTYEAHFTINSYTIVYMVDDEEYKRETLTYGSAITPLDEPIKKGYTFSGWSEIPAMMPAGDVIVTGSFIRTIFLTIQQADNGLVRQLANEGTTYKFYIVAADGWRVNTVTFNGEDVSGQLEEGNIFTSPEIYEDAVLNISFEKIDDNIEQTTSRSISVSGHANTITIKGTAHGDIITIHTLDGAMVANATATAETTSIEVSTQQVYIVKVADKVVKIGM